MAIDPSAQQAIKPREQEIIDAWEEGLSIERIAAQLGLSFSYVKQTVMLLCTGNGPGMQYIHAMKRSSDILRDRVLAARAVS